MRKVSKVKKRLLEVVNFVATTHLIGYKRCRSGDACQAISLIFVVANKTKICYSKIGGQTKNKGADCPVNDKEIIKAIRLITNRGNNAEVKRKRDGTLAVYEVKKNIVTSGKLVLDKSE